jgi:hypothetical protein
MYVDYGTKCRVKKSELRFMHMDYAQFPMQAIKASLVNLVPVGGGLKWPHEAGVHFLNLVRDKNLIAIVSSVDHEVTKNLSGYVIVKYSGPSSYDRLDIQTTWVTTKL